MRIRWHVYSAGGFMSVTYKGSILWRARIAATLNREHSAQNPEGEVAGIQGVLGEIIGEADRSKNSDI